MWPFLLSWVPVTNWLATEMPPTNHNALSHAPPMGVMESYLLVGGLVLALWGSIRLAIWLDMKIRTHALFREINRDLGIGGRAGRFGSHRRRQA